MVKRLLGPVLLFTAFATAAPAGAGNDETRAKELFFQGHEAADRGDHAAACKSFRQSLRYFRRVSTLLNLGKCSDQLGQIAEALRYWTEGAALLEPTDARMKLAKERLADLEARVPRLELEVPEPLPEGAAVELDGKVLPPERYASGLRLNPGVVYEVALIVPGHQASRERVELAEAELRQLALPLGAPDPVPSAASAPPVALPPTGLSGVQIGGIVLGAVGLAGIVTGGVTGGLVLDRKNTVETHCAEDVCTDPAGVDAADSGRILAAVSTAAFVGGGAALTAGVLMFVLGGPSETEAASASVHPSPGGGALVLSGRW
ncbi:MAG: hypothetical protein JRI23_05205 [Deltaproteobacteria bacterium]|jgi:hypothetical protein|nr:hypothetical protein [Deltaproteobacteria bacterium]MBW2530949.1 hypothetical protein [Deltaproteobacteria bacterium]